MSEHPSSPPLSPDRTAAPSPFPSSSPNVLRQDLETLVSSEHVDKGTALRITRLFHALETQLHRECYERDAALASVRAELQRVTLQHELDRLASRHHLADATPRSLSVSSRRR